MPEEHDLSLRPLRPADVRVIAAWAGDPVFWGTWTCTGSRLAVASLAT